MLSFVNSFCFCSMFIRNHFSSVFLLHIITFFAAVLGSFYFGTSTIRGYLRRFNHCVFLLFSEEKAKLLRKVGVQIDEKDQELVAFMSSLQLDHLNAHLQPNKLPQVNFQFNRLQNM